MLSRAGRLDTIPPVAFDDRPHASVDPHAGTGAQPFVIEWNSTNSARVWQVVVTREPSDVTLSRCDAKRHFSADALDERQ